MGTEESNNDDFAGLVRLLQTTYAKDWENHLRNFFGGSVPADLPPAELARLTEHVFWLVKQTGLRSPATWLEWAQQEAAIASAAPIKSAAPIERGGDQPEAIDPEPVKPAAEAAMRQTEGPQAAATPVAAKRRKQARGGGHRRKKRKLSAKASKARRRLLVERMQRMRVVLDSLSERPIQSYAARAAGIHRRTLENWIKHSKVGDAGFDIEHEGVIMRFHVHCEWSKEAAYDKILEAAYLVAMGKAYVTDENGNRTLKTVGRPNPKMMRFFLELVRPEVYGNKPPKPDVPQRSGVILVIPKKPKRTCPAASIKARSWKALSRKFRQAKD
jgi:hypothetical protein